jgi:hypothetical protein
MAPSANQLFFSSDMPQRDEEAGDITMSHGLPTFKVPSSSLGHRSPRETLAQNLQPQWP